MEYKYINQNLNFEKLSSMSDKQRTELCAEIRDRILNVVSQNGGHLASNLGTVELTVALLSVFDYEKDKFVFDVGHQTYAYKILTGRNENFDTLRQKGGVSGFPRISESKYDAFDTGHSATSVSAALGIARANRLLHKDSSVVAVIGDGALTGGPSYEAINDLGHAKEKMLVILNDNEMSIDKNVGGLSKYLRNLRMSSGYISVKKSVDQVLKENFPVLSKPLVKLILAVKDFFRFLIYRKKPTFFEDLGLIYYGPVDGHDMKALIKAFKAVKQINDPVILHVCTQKGRGYKFAEENPSDYHGVGPFDLEKGVVSKTGITSFTSAFSRSIVSIAKTNKKVAAVCAAMTSGTGLDEFAKLYPNRFFDCGIAEEHAVTMAGGLAVNGCIPVVAVYSTFMQRAFDQILQDCCYMNNHVVFCLDRAGCVGNDGHTHNGLFDLAYMNMMPQMTVLSPRDYTDLDRCLDYAINKMRGPVCIRYPRGSAKYDDCLYTDIADLPKPHIVTDNGNDFAVISFGQIQKNCDLAFEKVTSEGFGGKLINLTCVKPLPSEMLFDILKDVKTVFVVEEGIIEGGIGSSLMRKLCDLGFDGTFKCYGFTDSMVRAGTVDEQWDEFGLSVSKLSQSFIGVLKNKS